MLDQAGQTRVSDSDFVEFARAGAAAEGEYHCSRCGYGVTVRASLPQCPMCAGTTWEPADWSGFARPQFQA
jgi:rubrerythrin